MIYKFLDYTIELEDNLDFLGLEISRNFYTIHTNEGPLTRKACHKCKKFLDIKEFYDRKSPCRRCHVEAVKKWRRENPERDKAHKYRSNKKLRERARIQRDQVPTPQTKKGPGR